MDFYVTPKAGSVSFRLPRRQRILAGDQIPREVWDAVEPAVQKELLAQGMVQSADEPWSDPEPEEDLPRVGCGQDQFMPEAHIQPGERRDRALEELQREQQERAEAERARSEVDEDQGGSADGVVKVERAADEDEADAQAEQADIDEAKAAAEDAQADETLTQEELDEIARMEAEDN